jgi:hypothetical protein
VGDRVFQVNVTESDHLAADRWAGKQRPCEPLVERGRRWNSVIVFDGDSIQRVRHPRGDVGSDVYVSPTENVLLTDAGTEFS